MHIFFSTISNDAMYQRKQGLALKNNLDCEQKLAKLCQELKISSDYLKTSTQHFKINLDGDTLQESVINAILNALEERYKGLTTTLNYYPSEPIAVIFYANQDFKDFVNAPAWSGGFYDGKIRIPGKNIKISSTASAVLKHKLTHALLLKKTNYNAPALVHEVQQNIFKERKQVMQ